MKTPCSCKRNHPASKHELVTKAGEAQDADLALTTLSGKTHGPCQVCNGSHPTYDCCQDCNYDRHNCHFCGEELGHNEVSACYIVLRDEEAHPEEWK